jgi:hypothetical protein
LNEKKIKAALPPTAKITEISIITWQFIASNVADLLELTSGAVTYFQVDN